MEYLTSTVYILGICLLMIVCCCVYCCFFTKSTTESPLLQTTLENEKLLNQTIQKEQLATILHLENELKLQQEKLNQNTKIVQNTQKNYNMNGSINMNLLDRTVYPFKFNIGDQYNFDKNITYYFELLHNESTGRQNVLDKDVNKEGGFIIEGDKKLNFQWGDSNNKITDNYTNINIIPNLDYRIRMVRNNDTQTITWYVNGKKDKETKMTDRWLTPAKSDSPLVIGNDSVGKFYGFVQNVKIYFEALPEDHILALHNYCENKIEGFQTSFEDNYYKL